MVFNVSNVIHFLLEKFPDPVSSKPIITREEKKMATHLSNMHKEAIEGETWVETVDELVDERDGDWEVEEFQPMDDFKLASHEHFRFGNRSVDRDQMDDALEFYRQPEKGSRSLSAMMSRYRWIKGNNDIKKLREYEMDRDNFKEKRTTLLKLLSSRLYEVVKEKFENGYTLHDDGLMIIAKDLNQRETKIDGFVASQSWISRWKRSHRIVSRKITKFVTRKCLIDRAVIEKTAEDFVKTTRREMSLFSPSMIFNADQTGIQKEIYGARALSFLGDKDVHRLIQSKSSLTHSFTFLPTLYMDGTLGEKAFMLMAEPTGQFPFSRPIPNCPNLEVRCAKSHIMTKEFMRDWCRACVFTNSSPKRLFMLVDSWPSFRDHDSIQRCVLPGFDVTIRNIPPHTTSMIQPLDAHWNGPWKNFLKKFTAYVLAFDKDFIIAKRNNEIMMISLLYHQFSAKFFQEFLKYSWRKTGYLDKNDAKFLTPSQYCFGLLGNEDCCEQGCMEKAFIRCARCHEFYCFDHFIVINQHRCQFQ